MCVNSYVLAYIDEISRFFDAPIRNEHAGSSNILRSVSLNAFKACGCHSNPKWLNPGSTFTRQSDGNLFKQERGVTILSNGE